MRKNPNLSEQEIFISKQIQKLLDENNHIPSDLAKGISLKLNIPHKNALAKLISYLKNEVRWTNDFLRVIADTYNQSLDYIFGRNILSETILKEDSEAYLSSISKQIKVYGHIAAGVPIDMWNHEEFTVEVSHPALKNPYEKLYGFILKGDSMMPRYRDGDIVIAGEIKFKEEKPKNRDVVVTVFNSDPDSTSANVKLFNWANKEKNQFILKSINPYEIDSVHTLKEIKKMFKVYLSISAVNYKS